MEVGFLGFYRCPAKIVGHARCRGAFVEVAFYLDWKFRILYSDKAERDADCERPVEQPFQFLERTVATRGVAFYPGYFIIGQPVGIVALFAVRGIDSAYAVEFKVPIFVASRHLQEKFHATVLTYRRIVLVVYGAQVVAACEEIHINIFPAVGGGKCRYGVVGELLFPVHAVDGEFRGFSIKRFSHFSNAHIVKSFYERDAYPFSFHSKSINDIINPITDIRQIRLPMIMLMSHMLLTLKWPLTLLTKYVIVNHQANAPIMIERNPQR